MLVYVYQYRSNIEIYRQSGYIHMKALFEKSKFLCTRNTSAIKYKNLHNLPHWHMEYELVFVFEGTAELMINNSVFEISPGACALINSEYIHYIKGTPESIIGIIKTDSNYVKKIIGNRHLSSPIIHNSSNLLEVFESVYAEFKSENDLYEIAAELIVANFIIDIFRKKSFVFAPKKHKQTSEKYKILLEMLANNYAYVTFENAAEYLDLNKSYFSKYFHHFSGMTFTQYLNILKVSAAIEKIHEKNMNMTEISISCGFGTIRNFNRVFKSLTGYCPKNIPDNFTYIHSIKGTTVRDFDPTLNCTEIIQ